MRTVTLAMRRSTSQAGILSTVCAVTLVLTALVVGLIGYLDFSATVNTRNFIDSAAPTARSLRVETKLGNDPAAQSAAATSFFTREFAGMPVDTTRTLIDFPLSATRNGTQLSLSGSEARITPMADAALASHAKLVAGAWPAFSSGSGVAVPDPIPAALQADAAKSLGLAVGDVLAVGSGSEAKNIQIVATWLPKDAADPRWFSDTGVAGGTALPAGDGTPSFGPLVVDDAAIATLGPVPFVHWVIAVDSHLVTPGQLDRLGTIAGTLRQDIIDGKKIGTGDVLVEGTLAQSAATVQRNLASVRGVTPVGILLVALIGLVALVQLARLLSLARRPENALLRSRGASAQWLTTAGVIEAAVVGAIGCALGFAAAALVLVASYGTDAAVFAPWEFAVLVAAAVLAIFGVTAFLDSIRLAKRDAIDDSGRARTAATIGTAALALAAAGVSVWQSLLYGSPLVTSADGRVSINPLAVVAPTIALIAIALVFLVLFAPLATAWQRIAAKRAALQPSYSARQIARGLGSYAVAVLVVSLSVGGLVIASAYSGSWHTLSLRNAELISGADARVNLTDAPFPRAGSTPETGVHFLAVKGVSAAAPVFSTPISIGDDADGRLTGIPAHSIPTVVSTASGAVDPSALAKAVSGFSLKGIALPVGATSIGLDATLSVTSVFDVGGRPLATTGYTRTTVWLQNADGALLSSTFPDRPVDSSPATAHLSLDLPKSESAWTLVAIDYLVKADSGWLETNYTNLTAMVGSTSTPVAFDAKGWGPQLSFTFSSGSNSDENGVSVSLPGLGSQQAMLRMMYINAKNINSNGGFYSSDSLDPLKLVVSAELADHYNLHRGDPYQFRFAGSGLTISGTISTIVPILPGARSPNAILVDLNALNDYVLRSSDVVPTANQVWLATNGPVSLSSAIPDGAIPDGATVVTPASAVDDSFATPAERALWVAAIGCLLLAAISLGAVALTVARARRGEVAVLRAVGIAARQQSGARLAELTAVILLSVLFGVLGGVAVSSLTVTNLARSAVFDLPQEVQSPLSFALIEGGVLLGASVAVMLVIAAVSAARVRRQALDTSERIETR